MVSNNIPKILNRNVKLYFNIFYQTWPLRADLDEHLTKRTVKCADIHRERLGSDLSSYGRQDLNVKLLKKRDTFFENESTHLQSHLIIHQQGPVKFQGLRISI